MGEEWIGAVGKGGGPGLGGVLSQSHCCYSTSKTSHIDIKKILQALGDELCWVVMVKINSSIKLR